MLPPGRHLNAVRVKKAVGALCYPFKRKIAYCIDNFDFRGVGITL